MTIPAVGVIAALAFTAVIDTPARFGNARAVRAYLGLTPRRYQSGEIDCAGHISKCGDPLARSYLFQSANGILTRKVKYSALRDWGRALAARIGLRRATVAVARKLAVIMHTLWHKDRDFDPQLAEAAAAWRRPRKPPRRRLEVPAGTRRGDCVFSDAARKHAMAAPGTSAVPADRTPGCGCPCVADRGKNRDPAEAAPA